MSDERLHDDDEAIAITLRGLRKERPVTDEQVAALAARLSGATRFHRRHWIREIAVAAALSVVAFLAGRMTHGVEPHDSVSAAATRQANYMLLIHEDVPAHADSATLHAEYGRWAATLAERGHLIGGEELGDDRLLIAPPEPNSVRHTSARATRTIGGYFILTARNESEALAIARECPHLRHGGTVELRKIVRR